jgi:hypothetical protein
VPVTRRRRPSTTIPPVARQVDDICERFGILKQDVAQTIGLTPSYFSQLVRAEPKLAKWRSQIEALTKAINSHLRRRDRIRPEFFDRYVALAALPFIEETPAAARLMRSLLFTMSDKERADWLAEHAPADA